LGLTTHYDLSVPQGLTPQAVLERLRQCAMDLPVADVSDLRRLRGEECLADLGDLTRAERARIRDIGLPELQLEWRESGFKAPTEDDHVWHELVRMERTNEPPNFPMTARKLAERFTAITGPQGWDEQVAILRLGTPEEDDEPEEDDAIEA